MANSVLRRLLGHQPQESVGENPALADDLLQDLFLKALRQGERFCAVENARAWLFEVANTVDTLTACLPRPAAQR